MVVAKSAIKTIRPDGCTIDKKFDFATFLKS